MCAAEGIATTPEEALFRVREAFKNDEFALYAQPIEPLRGGRRIAETLVRLREEEQAMLPPGEFLPVLEHYGMLSQLDCWVLKRLLEHLAAGSRAAQLSMNVSAQTLELADFPGLFAKFASAAGVPTLSVLVEVEESDVAAHPQAAARFAAGIRAAGAGLVIDGFGREAGGFARIQPLAPDYVKVDRSIVTQLLRSDAASRKLESLVRVAASLRIGVIAECVEEPEVLARIQALGVAYAQGFGVARPMPVEELALTALPVAA